MLTSKRIDSIVDDLLKKRPSGRDGVDLTYTISREWNERTYRYKDIPMPSVKNYGYEDETLFMLGFEDLNSIKNYARERWFTSHNIGPQKSTITRRSNRLWDRIAPAVRKVRNEGSRGIYRLTENGYSTPNFTGYIFADNLNEAHALVRTFFPSLGESYALKFKEVGDVENLKAYNRATQQGIESKVERIELDITRSQKKISKLKNYASTLQTLSGHQLAVESA